MGEGGRMNVMNFRSANLEDDLRERRLAERLTELLAVAATLQRQLAALVGPLQPEPAPFRRLAVRNNGQVLFLAPEEIEWIEAAGNYVRLHLGEEAHLFRETMTRMEARLDTRRFVRIHRSRIVNTERIKELQPWFNGEYVVVLRNGTRLPLSRGYRD